MPTFKRRSDDNAPQGTCLIVTAGIAMVDSVDRVRKELEHVDYMAVLATPTAHEWMEEHGIHREIEALTGEAVQSTYRSPWDEKPGVTYDKCIVAPVTLNTLTKWADGHADNLALSMLCEATWTRGVDVVAHLTLNGAYRFHPAADRAIDILKDADVEVVPLEPGDEMTRILEATYTSEQSAHILRARPASPS